MECELSLKKKNWHHILLDLTRQNQICGWRGDRKSTANLNESDIWIPSWEGQAPSQIFREAKEQWCESSAWQKLLFSLFLCSIFERTLMRMWQEVLSLYFFFSIRTLMREFSMTISSFLCFLLQKNIFTRAPLDKKFLFRDLSFNDSSSCDSQWVRGSNFQGSPFSKFPANYQSFTLQMLIR